jgi:hypothetical protein
MQQLIRVRVFQGYGSFPVNKPDNHRIKTGQCVL